MASKSTLLLLIRVAVLIVMFFFAVSLVIAIGRPETGPVEKLTLGGMLLAIVALARPVHQIG